MAMVSYALMIMMALAASAIAVRVDSVDLTTFSNSTISCNWPSVTDLVGDVQTYKLNATDIVSQCANVCGLLFESSNPDLAGEGILISYYIQTTLGCLFGPIFPVLLYIINLLARQVVVRNLPLWRKLQHSVYRINAFFSICLVVGAIVIHHQAPSILEVVFINQLSTGQMMQIVTMVWAQWGDNAINRSEGSKLGWAWNLYYFALGAAQLGTSYAVSLPDRTQTVYSDLAKQCQDQYNLIHVSGYIKSSSTGNSALKWLGLGTAVGAGISVLGCVLAVPLAKFYAWITNVLPKWLKAHGIAMLFTVILGFYTSIVILNAIIMDDFRNTWKKLAGDLFQDNEWGFGQTTAILLWAPFAWGVIKETIKHWREPPRNSQNEAEMQALDPEAAPSQMAEAVPPPYSPGEAPPKHTLS